MDIFEDRCRVCLRLEEKLLRDLTLQSDPNEKISLQTAFEAITTISVNSFDKDRFLCEECVLRLESAFEFRCQALNSSNSLTGQVEMVIATQLNIKQEKDDFSDQGDDSHFFEAEPWVKDEPDPPLKYEQDKPAKKKKVDPSQRKTWKKRERELKRAIKRGEKENFLNKAHCRFCLVHFPTKLGDHERQHIMENGGMECEKCGKKFLSRKILLEHIYRIHFMDRENRKRFPCEICGKTYSEKSAVRVHKKAVHLGIKKIVPTFICTICGKEQKGRHALENHIDMVHNNKIVAYCNECGKGFKTKVALSNHLKYVHLKLRDFQCHICLKSYIHALELKRHITGVHTNARPYHCVTCNKFFKTEPILKAHMKLHKSDFNYPCQICGMTFKTLSYVKGHMKAHSDQCDFQCQHCPKKFKRSGQLTKHMRVHTGNFFYCTLCSVEGFIDLWSLNEHIERVHVGVKYRCSTCGKEYGTRKHLRQHQNTQLHDRTKWTKIDPRKLGQEDDQKLE